MSLSSDIAERIENQSGVRFAVLYGSAATGKQTPNSDLDVGVFVKPDLDARERFELRLRLGGLLSDLGTPDVVILNDVSALLGHRALMGELLFAHDRSEYVRYFVRTIAASEDERYFRDIHARARRDRLEEGRFGRP